LDPFHPILEVLDFDRPAGPLVRPEETFHALEPGDEIQVAVEKLGTLSTKIE